MDITKFGNEIKEVGKDPKQDLLRIEDVFNKTLQIGKYTFKIKQIKGQDLFKLVNTFMFSGASADHNLDEDEVNMQILEDVFNKFGSHFDFAMKYLEFSINGAKYNDLLVNGLYQVPEVETNITIMYKLMFFIYQAVMLFTQISRQQLEDMN